MQDDLETILAFDEEAFERHLANVVSLRSGIGLRMIRRQRGPIIPLSDTEVLRTFGLPAQT